MLWRRGTLSTRCSVRGGERRRSSSKTFGIREKSSGSGEYGCSRVCVCSVYFGCISQLIRTWTRSTTMIYVKRVHCPGLSVRSCVYLQTVYHNPSFPWFPSRDAISVIHALELWYTGYSATPTSLIHRHEVDDLLHTRM